MGSLATCKHISGKLPQELGNLPNIQRIFLSSNYLSGDIPSIFSKLTTLIDLRISELSGPGSPFPPLQNMTSIKTLDLSFNKLGGPIPVTYSALSRVNIFLTSNMLNGEVPSWMVDNGDKIDLIYNNFTNDPRTAECQKNAVNMFSSTSPLVANDYSNVSCLSSYICPKNKYLKLYTHHNTISPKILQPFYGLHINCGGIELTVNGTKYDADSTDRPIFYDSRNGWVSSNTGKFMDDERSPKGVTFGANTFNIVDEAKGVGRAVVKSFLVMITNGKLEIRLFWAGKGTQATPVRDFIPPKEAGTGSGCCCSCFDGVICGFNRLYLMVERLLKTQESNGKKSLFLPELYSVSCSSSDFKNLDFKISSFSLRQIKVATNNFDPANKIGEGGFGPVHKGTLTDGTVIAVKQLSSKSKQGNREFLNEIGMISALQHPHLVKLYGCCVDGHYKVTTRKQRHSERKNRRYVVGIIPTTYRQNKSSE
ncbi:unnamed protein product, partial [Brassica oleracea]